MHSQDRDAGASASRRAMADLVESEGDKDRSIVTSNRVRNGHDDFSTDVSFVGFLSSSNVTLF